MDPTISPQSNPPILPVSRFQLLQNPKIIILVLGVFAVIIGGFLFFSLRSNNSDVPDQSDEQTQVPSITISPTPGVEQVESVYADSFFTFDYPDDWTVHSQTTTDATIVIFQEQNLSEKRPVYMITYDTSPQTLEERVEFLSTNNFRRSVVLHTNIPFIRLQGTMPFRQIDGELAEVTTQEASLYARLNGKYVTIKYLYTGDQRDESLESLFSSFIEQTQFRVLDQ
ncbi:MAG TPA: hypothetical protein PLD54_03380 [Candidatus Levybacteria bacterium]|nr:hypothetical protein [Candidatus Levybacteria bacterium]